MKQPSPVTGVGWLYLVLVSTACASPSGPAFPGNEAVRIVDGKRLVEAPPLTASTQRYVNGGGKLPPPSPGGEVYMIEGRDGLVECRSVYLSPTGCTPSTLGSTKRRRFWTVKLRGVWEHCDARTPSRHCEPASVGVPGGMGTVE